MTTLFVSDLHLEPERPDIAEQFFDFLAGPAAAADALYILGDLFEAWIGDDDPEPHYADVQDALAALTRAGTPGWFMRGNRDFLVGRRFAERTGFSLLDDPTVLELYGEPVLVSHGDRYCTDDEEYQAVRRRVRDPEWQRQVLALPPETRRQIAEGARAESKAANAAKRAEIMDVNDEAIAAAMREHGVQRMLHGHTHRPAVHRFELDGAAAVRIVLGDWYDQGSVLTWDDGGYRLSSLPRN